MLDVSSDFLVELEKKTSFPVRRIFLDVSTWDASSNYVVNSVDVSDRIIKWPTIKTDWNAFRPNNITFALANEDQFLNRLHQDGLHLVHDCVVEIGFDSIPEYVQIFKGNIHRLRFTKGKVDISVTDKWNKLSRVIAGTDETPLDYTGSDYMAHDLFWYLCTSAGGLDSTQDSSNPDIDYPAWEAFREVSSQDAIYMRAYMEGEKVSENLARFGRLTDSAIYVNENNKLTIKRYSLYDTLSASLTNDHLIGGMDFVFDENNINNRVYATADYNVDSDSFGTTVVQADSASVNSYGLYERYYDDDVIWFVGSTSALSLCQRRTSLYSTPNEEISVATSLVGMAATVGDVIHVADTLIDIDTTYRVLYREIDLHNLAVKMKAHRATLLDAFILDSSLLDGDDILT